MSKCSTGRRKKSAHRGDKKKKGGVSGGPQSVATIGIGSRRHMYGSICHSSISCYFLFSFKWRHSKTWVASYPSELFISDILPKSLEVCWKNRTLNKTLKGASCFNILGGGGTESNSVLKDHLCLTEGQWNGTGKVQDHFIVPFPVDSGHCASGGLYTVNKQASGSYFWTWHNTAALRGGRIKTGARGSLKLRKPLTQLSILLIDRRAKPWPFHLVVGDRREQLGGVGGRERQRQRQRKIKVH